MTAEPGRQEQIRKIYAERLLRRAVVTWDTSPTDAEREAERQRWEELRSRSPHSFWSPSDAPDTIPTDPARDHECALVERRSDGLFHIGQVYDEAPAETVWCRQCGGNQFYVGSGSRYTAVKCVRCEWEVAFHDG